MRLIRTKYGPRIVPTYDEILLWVSVRRRVDRGMLAEQFRLTQKQAAGFLSRLQENKFLKVYRTKPFYSYELTKQIKDQFQTSWDKEFVSEMLNRFRRN